MPDITSATELILCNPIHSAVAIQIAISIIHVFRKILSSNLRSDLNNVIFFLYVTFYRTSRFFFLKCHETENFVLNV